jgi:hypothetical protein
MCIIILYNIKQVSREYILSKCNAIVTILYMMLHLFHDVPRCSKYGTVCQFKLWSVENIRMSITSQLRLITAAGLWQKMNRTIGQPDLHSRADSIYIPVWYGIVSYSILYHTIPFFLQILPYMDDVECKKGQKQNIIHTAHVRCMSTVSPKPVGCITVNLVSVSVCDISRPSAHQNIIIRRRREHRCTPKGVSVSLHPMASCVVVAFW